MEVAVDAVDPDDATTVHRDLAEAAIICLRAATRHGDERSAALHLLAADALITIACEAAAEEGTAALEALCADATPARLSHLVALPAVPDPADGGIPPAAGRSGEEPLA